MEIIDFGFLKRMIQESRDKKVAITFHSIGDTDSIASAFGLAKIFKNPTIAMPDYITVNSKRILERLGFDEKQITTKFPNDANTVIMLDVNNFDDCGVFKEKLANFSGRIIIIDHHLESELSRTQSKNVYAFNDESYNSTASIIYDILESLTVNFESETAELLATGILSDSAEFRNASPQTFIQIGKLLKLANKSYSNVLLDMQHIAAPENRADAIRNLFGSTVVVRKGILFIYGIVDSHANHAADNAIKIGADVALFYTSHNTEVSFSARLRPPLDKDYNIHLGLIMKRLAPIIKGQGGGHPGAAGAYGPFASKSEEFKDKFIQEIVDIVQKKKQLS